MRKIFFFQLLSLGFLLIGCENPLNTIDEKTILSREDFKTLLQNPKNRESLSLLFQPLGDYPSNPVKNEEARQMIRNLYDTLKKDNTFFTKNVQSSYAYNLSAIAKVAIQNSLGSLDKLQMRIYPVQNNDGNFSIMVAIENNDAVLIRDDQLFEYVSPCPRNCPQKQDIFEKKEWELEFEKINRKKEITDGYNGK